MYRLKANHFSSSFLEELNFFKVKPSWSLWSGVKSSLLPEPVLSILLFSLTWTCPVHSSLLSDLNLSDTSFSSLYPEPVLYILLFSLTWTCPIHPSLLPNLNQPVLYIILFFLTWTCPIHDIISSLKPEPVIHPSLLSNLNLGEKSLFQRQSTDSDDLFSRKEEEYLEEYGNCR